MQLQDFLVNSPDMSEREKKQTQGKIKDLTAQKEVLDWKAASAGTPTVENYEAQKSYYDRLWQQNQDAIVNGLGNGTLEQGSDEWYALLEKGDDLLAMKDTYNKGMMGLLDGQKAQTAEEAAAMAGGGRSAGFDANDEAMFTGGTAPGIDDGEEENQTVGDSNDTTEPDTSDFDTLKDLMERATANVQGEYVYITEEQYEAIKDIIEQSLEERLATDSPTPSDIDEAQQMYALEQNREWSKNSDLCDAIIVNVDEPYGNVDIDRMEELSNDDEPRTPEEEELLAKINLGIGVRIDINGSDFAALKEQLGAYGAAQFLAEYVQDNYGEDVLDDRSVNGFIAEVYIHDYINTMIPDDFDYSEIEDRQLAEALLGWKDTGEELNIAYFHDANREKGEQLADLLGVQVTGIWNENLLNNAAKLWMINDYRDRNNLWEAIQLVPKLEYIQKYGLEEAIKLF